MGPKATPDDYLVFIKNGLKERKKLMKIYHQLIEKEVSKLLPYIDKDKFFGTLIDSYFEPILSGKIDWVDGVSDAFIMIYMDVYVLSRLFMSFDVSKMERGPIGCRSSQYREIKNVIIYGGADHITLYKTFFNKYFSVDPSISYDTQPRQCIELSEPFDFFAN